MSLSSSNSKVTLKKLEVLFVLLYMILLKEIFFSLAFNWVGDIYCGALDLRSYGLLAKIEFAKNKYRM